MLLNKKSISLFLATAIASAPIFPAMQGHAIIDADARTIALRADENALTAYGLWFKANAPGPNDSLTDAAWVWNKLLTETRAIKPLKPLSQDSNFTGNPHHGEILHVGFFSDTISDRSTPEKCAAVLRNNLNSARTTNPLRLYNRAFLRDVAPGTSLSNCAEFHATRRGGFGAVVSAVIPVDADDSAVAAEILPEISQRFREIRPELFDPSRELAPWETLLKTVAENPELACAFAGVGFVFGPDSIVALNPSLVLLSSECTLVPTDDGDYGSGSVALGQGRGSKVTADGEPDDIFELPDYTIYQKIQLQQG
jgi:hypothetical protein